MKYLWVKKELADLTFVTGDWAKSRIRLGELMLVRKQNHLKNYPTGTIMKY